MDTTNDQGGVQVPKVDPSHLGQHVIAEFFQADFDALANAE